VEADMTDLMRLVDDHANLWRRVGSRALTWPAVDAAELLTQARELSKALKAEIARLQARLAGLEPLLKNEEVE
jgi:hypothetical protein